MNRFAQFIRLLHINFVLARYGVDRFILRIPLFYPFRFISYFNPYYWINKRRGLTRGECLRLALEALGPIFVKFGQILSTRADLLPDDIAFELAKLQDRVPPFPSDVAIKIIEKAFAQPINTMFSEFEATPLASASIAQVHSATLQNGRSVVVKVLRPNIKKVINRDISLLYTCANLIEKFWTPAKRLRARDVVTEFEHTILDELDLMREAANASQLRRNFEHSQLLYVPEVFWDYARTNVVVFERIYGIPISHVDTLRQQGYDLKKLAERGVQIFFKQVFHDSFFHADMHPGNIFVAKRDPKNPQYIGVDFGIMGTLSPEDQRYLAENMLAFFKRDYRRVAILHVESGWVPSDTRIEEFEGTIRAVCEPIFARPLKDISFGKLLLRLFQTARRFHMEVQPQLMLLQKTLINIEGLGRQLYPDLDLWKTGQPYLEQWMKQQAGPRAFLLRAKERGPFWWEQLAEMPDLAYEFLKTYKQAPMRQPLQTLNKEVAKAESASRHFAFGFAIAFLLAALLHFIFLEYRPGKSLALEIILLSAAIIALLLSWIIKDKNNS